MTAASKLVSLATRKILELKQKLWDCLCGTCYPKGKMTALKHEMRHNLFSHLSGLGSTYTSVLGEACRAYIEHIFQIFGHTECVSISDTKNQAHLLNCICQMKEVCEKYTWEVHVKRTLDKCYDMFGGRCFEE